jgi:hypothetical protein
VDDGSEERFNKWTICIEERLELIKIDFIDTFSTEQAKIEARPESASARREGVASLGVPSTSYSARMARAT